MGISEFQKQTLKVTGIFTVVLVLAYGVAYVGDNLYYEPLEKRVMEAVAGTATYECMTSEAVKKEHAAQAAIDKSPILKTMKRQLIYTRVGSLVIELGLLYLGSGFIVRMLRGKSN